MSLAIASLLALLVPQDEARSFTKDARLTAARYYLLPAAKPQADFLEMERAGIDIALVEFTGDAQALDPLVAALDALVTQKKDVPRLAVFLSPGAKGDLGAADVFYDRVPKRHAARIDGRLVVWLGPAPPEAAGLDDAVQKLREPPYLVAEVSWKTKSDLVY